MTSGFKSISSEASSLVRRRPLLVQCIAIVLVFSQCVRDARFDASQVMTFLADDSAIVSASSVKEQIAPVIQASPAINTISDNQTTATTKQVSTKQLVTKVKSNPQMGEQAPNLQITADIAPLNQTTRTIEKTTIAKNSTEEALEENPPMKAAESPLQPYAVTASRLPLNQTTSTNGTTSLNGSKYRASTGSTSSSTTDPIKSMRGNTSSASSIKNLSSSVCKEKGGHKLLQYDKNPPYPHNLSFIFRGPGLAALNDPNVTRAICVVDDLSRNWVHVLQLLYPCISFWQTAPPHQQRVLANREGKKQRYWPGFIQGVVKYLTLLLDVSVVNGGYETLATNDTVRAYMGNGWDLEPTHRPNINAYDVVTPLHLNIMRDRIIQHVYENDNNNINNKQNGSTTYALTNTCNTASSATILSTSDNTLDDGKSNITQLHVHHHNNHLSTTTAQRHRVPRIRILNRKRTRSILNVDELAEAIWQRLGGGGGGVSGGMLPPKVSIEYFEETDFEYQVRSMAETDILISPHGAQLGSLPFLPDCSQVLELFPEGYWIPAFYGSLAQAGGSGYQYLYLGGEKGKDSTMQKDTKTTIATWGGRIHARKQKLCAPLEAVLTAVDEMVQKWHSCCDRIVL